MCQFTDGLSLPPRVLSGGSLARGVWHPGLRSDERFIKSSRLRLPSAAKNVRSVAKDDVMSRQRNEILTGWAPSESAYIRRESAKSPRQIATKSVALSPFDENRKSSHPLKDDCNPASSRRRMRPNSHIGSTKPSDGIGVKLFHPSAKAPDGIFPQATAVQRLLVESFSASAFAVAWPAHPPASEGAPPPNAAVVRPPPEAPAGVVAPRPQTSHGGGDKQSAPRCSKTRHSPPP